MKRLIVNADDFGLTAKVNEAIIDGHCRGLISSTSLLANGEAFESAVALSRQAPRLGIGVHWNLTEGKPIAPGSSIPSLVNGNGFFARTPGSLWRAIILGRVSTVDIERELRAQIEKVLAAGVAPTHLDSHKHVHALPVLGKMGIKLAREYGIGAIRCVAERWPAPCGLLRRYPRATTTIIRQLLNGCALALISRGWRRQLPRAGVACASHFCGLTATGFLDEEILGEILSHLPEGTSELMCHAGIVDNALRRTPTRLLEQREMEYRALTQPAMKRLAQDLGIQLVNYREMVGLKAARVSQEEGSNPN
jgi:hopanoid biosynthesis associated protein HpnK